MSTAMPAALNRLPEVARNLRWNWDPEAQALFAALAPGDREPGRHDPLALIITALPPSRLVPGT